MAKTPSDLKKEYPIPVYNYIVSIGQKTMAFSEVSGLSLSFETTTYKQSPGEGESGVKTMQMPAQEKAPTITLKRGIIPTDSIKYLYDWIKGTAINQVDKRDVEVKLVDESGKDAYIVWTVKNAFPTKLDAPTFDASSNDVAVESIELVGDSISID